MKASKKLETSKEVKSHLLNVLSRTGGKSKDNVFLYHYSTIQALLSIIKYKCIWLGSTGKMNDYLESEFINSVEGENRLFYSCFSRAEENLAMYKMYAPSPNGAMLILPFKTAQLIIDNLADVGCKKLVRIVRDGKLTNETIEADVYWAAVAYKDLHTELLRSEAVVCNSIPNPLDDPELAGFVKLYGWEYEKEVRLCASTAMSLNPNERIAVELPNGIEKKISIITGPEFDKDLCKKELSNLKRRGVSIHDSEYDALVDLGYRKCSKEEQERLESWRLERVFKTRAEKNFETDILLENHQIKELDGIAFEMREFRTLRDENLLGCMKKGARVRFLVMDPDSEFVKYKAEEEGVSKDDKFKAILELTKWIRLLNEKLRNHLGRELAEDEGIQLKYYNAMTLDYYWRVDDRLYFGPYWYGIESMQTVTYEYRKGGRGYKLYCDHFEMLWNDDNLTKDVNVK